VKYLRQNTATPIRFGRFVDSTDAVTPEVALTITPAMRKLSKAGAAFAATSDGSNAVHDTEGFYSCTLTATDLNMPGSLELSVVVSGACPYQDRFAVLTAQAYDAMFIHPLIAQAIHYGQLQGGGAAAATLATSASSVDDYYNGRLAYVYDGTGAGQVGYIQDYVGSSRGCVMAENWLTTVDATSKVIILPWSKLSTLAEMSAAYGAQQLSGALHAYNARPTRDQALLYVERFLAGLVQATSTTDNVKDVNGTSNLATITYSPDNTSPTSRLRTA